MPIPHPDPAIPRTERMHHALGRLASLQAVREWSDRGQAIITIPSLLSLLHTEACADVEREAVS